MSMPRRKALADQTVKAQSWHMLQAMFRDRLGAEGWDKLCLAAGAPNFTTMDPDENCPMGPFNNALTQIDHQLGAGDGALIEEVARAYVSGWARLFKNLVDQLRGRPDKMMEIFCTEVQSYNLNDAEAGEIIESSSDRFILKLDNGLLEQYKLGLLTGFCDIVGAEVKVTKRDEAYHLTWKIRPETPEPSRWALFVNATRLPFLTASIVPVFVGTAVAWKDGFLNAPLFLLVFFGAAFFHIGANVINDYFDHTSGVDEANRSPTPFSGGSRLIQRGLLKPSSVRNLALVFYALGTAIGLVLMFLRGWQVLIFGATGFVLGWIYTAPPFRLVHRGVGEIAIGIAFGPVIVMGSYWVQAMRWSSEALLASIPVGLLIAAVLYINEFPDRLWDARMGKRTLVTRLPLRAAIVGYGLLVGAAYFVILAGVLFDVLTLPSLLALLTLPAAWRAYRLLLRFHSFPYRLIPANEGTIFTHLTTGMLLFLGYVIAGFGRII
jgi:1,4-dihydroxy-2-naphthoate octaprenyltransferase